MYFKEKSVTLQAQQKFANSTFAPTVAILSNYCAV